MRVLVIGSGGREHALVWKLRQSILVKEIFVAPGNGGTSTEYVTSVNINADAIEELVNFAIKEKIDFVVPGPELPLTLGITNAMEEANILCFGPSRYCAQLEGSKSFAKEAMLESNIPTAYSESFTDYDLALEYINNIGAPIVIKADGLAAGKGVIVAHSLEEAIQGLDTIMLGQNFASTDNKVLIEEYLDGEEVSLMCFCDGINAIALPSAQDHKAIFDGDKGPNTGGMGAYCPAPILPNEDLEAMVNMVITPILRLMSKRGHPFKGILYAGLMITPSGPKVLEYNTRFGDPECQPLLMCLKNDLAEIMLASVKGQLGQIHINYDHISALGIVIAAEGYPNTYAKGMTIEGIAQAQNMPNVKIFHSGTKLEKNVLQSSGGRILCITATGDTLDEAHANAYNAVKILHIPQTHYRKDIGEKGLLHKNNMEGEQIMFRPKIAIFIGSISDESTISPCADTLRSLNIPYIFTVSSAHRSPERTEALVKDLEDQGVQIYICAAGMAAHLAGAVAARTIKPVIGIPVTSSALGGMDSLLATVQMPPGFPVATVALDKAGAKNAAWLAAQILAVNDKNLEERLLAARNVFKADVAKVGEELLQKHKF